MRSCPQAVLLCLLCATVEVSFVDCDLQPCLCLQALYPGPPVYPVWQHMCSVMQPLAADAGAYGGGGSNSSFHSGSGSGFATGSGSGFHSGSGSGCASGGDAVVPSMRASGMPLQGGSGRPSNSIWAEELEMVTDPTALQARAVQCSFASMQLSFGLHYPLWVAFSHVTFAVQCCQDRCLACKPLLQEHPACKDCLDAFWHRPCWQCADAQPVFAHPAGAAQLPGDVRLHRQPV